MFLLFRLQFNDGSGKLPAYRSLVDAVQSIVRTSGLNGLYQVSNHQFSDLCGPFCVLWSNADYLFIFQFKRLSW